MSRDYYDRFFPRVKAMKWLVVLLRLGREAGRLSHFKKRVIIVGMLGSLLLCQGCTWVRNDFMGKPAWYWSKAAKYQRVSDQMAEEFGKKQKQDQ